MTKLRALAVSSLLAVTLLGGAAAASTSGTQAAPSNGPASLRDIWCC